MDIDLKDIQFCNKCRYMMLRPPVNPFKDVKEWTPELLKRKLEWDNKQRELAYLEKQRYEAHEDFDFEPHFYKWCYKWTKEEGKLVIDPVEGTKAQVYVLCAVRNPKGQCQYFEQK